MLSSKLKTLLQIVEAVPVRGFKPAKVAKPKGPRPPAQPSRSRAQVMTNKGRLSTVKTNTAITKPGYRFIKYMPPKERGARPAQHSKLSHQPKKPIKPADFGKTLNEMKVTKYKFNIDVKTYGDPDVGIPHGKHVEDITGEIVVEWKPGELSDPIDWEDEVIQEAEATVAENEDLHVRPGEIKWKVTKIGPTSAKLTVEDYDIKNLREVKSLTQLIKEAKKCQNQ